MKISVVVNAYNRRQYIDRAVKSAEDADEIIAVVNFPYSSENPKVKVIEVEESPVGLRYEIGMRETTGDVIALLDDDDYFNGKIEVLRTYKYLARLPNVNYVPGTTFFKDVQIPRRVNPYDLSAIMRYHLDWDLSRTCFSRVMVDYLSDFCFPRAMTDCLSDQGIGYSYDKYLYYIALKNGMSIEIVNYPYTVKTKNSNSRMATLRATKSLNGFYMQTSLMFEKLFRETEDGIAKDYAELQYRYNLFLATGKSEVLGKMEKYVPLSRKIYHKIRRW